MVQNINIMYVYAIQSERIHRIHPKHCNLENHCFCYIRPQKSPKIAQKTITQSQFSHFLNWYGIFWMAQGESSCPGGSDYVWQRGVGGLKGRVTGGRS